MWIFPEEIDPVLPHLRLDGVPDPFGAIRLRDGKLVYRREQTRFNAETCFDFLHQLWTVSLRSDRRVIVIADNVRYHHAELHKEWRQAAEPWFKLGFLPPYSPDLNPIERIWKPTRCLAAPNRCLPELGDSIAAVENRLNQWRKGSDTLRRLCAIS